MLGHSRARQGAPPASCGRARVRVGAGGWTASAADYSAALVGEVAGSRGASASGPLLVSLPPAAVL